MRYFSDFNAWYKSQINCWIRYAITSNVQEVNIELWDGAELGKFRYDDDFFFKNLCAIQMKLTLCVFKNPIGAISWEKLKCLCISAGILDEEVIADILSGSPCLETLQLDYCHGFSSINVTSKSVKNLVFSTYDSTTFFDQDDIIKINAPYNNQIYDGFAGDFMKKKKKNCLKDFYKALAMSQILHLGIILQRFSLVWIFEGADDIDSVDKRRLGGTNFFVLAGSDRVLLDRGSV
ncbi:ribonuclease H-like domain-containing protein [Tanacetum coccineum]